jgi:hypothetical protein
VIALVHLVWGPLGAGPLRAFLAAYGAHDAGADHELVVLFNGVGDRSEFTAALAGVEHRLIELPAPLQDLAAYGEAARQIECDQLCFVNSYCEPLADGWLALLAGAGAGLAAATGSYESLADLSHGPWIRRAQKLVGLRALRREFPPFPNPHVRSNALLLSRSLALSSGLERALDKPSAYALESGRRSITRQASERGLSVVVVGRDGRVFEPSQWPTSGTFRSGEQENLLVADNQTRAYAQAPEAVRAALRRAAWGPVSRAAGPATART